MMSGPCTSSAWNAWRRASTGGTPFGDQPARLVLVLLAPGLRPDLVDHVAQLRERIARLVHRLARSAAPRRRTRYQREVVSTSQSTPFISSFCSSGSIWPSSASTSAHRSIDAGHVAGDPERPHHVGRARARLGHHPRDERDALGVHDVVRQRSWPPARAAADGPRSGGRTAPPPPAGSTGLQILAQVRRVGQVRVRAAPRRSSASRTRAAPRARAAPALRPPPRRSPICRARAGTRPRAPARLSASSCCIRSS